MGRNAIYFQVHAGCKINIDPMEFCRVEFEERVTLFISFTVIFAALSRTPGNNLSNSEMDGKTPIQCKEGRMNGKLIFHKTADGMWAIDKACKVT